MIFFVLEPVRQYFANLDTKHFNELRLYLKEVLTGESPGTVPIGLPKFKVENSCNITGVLNVMGINTTGLSFKDIGLDLNASLEVKQLTAVEVNESGASAAEVTVVEGYPACPNMFIADHPFAYFIYEAKTDALLMAGIFANPE